MTETIKRYSFEDCASWAKFAGRATERHERTISSSSLMLPEQITADMLKFAVSMLFPGYSIRTDYDKELEEKADDLRELGITYINAYTPNHKTHVINISC